MEAKKTISADVAARCLGMTLKQLLILKDAGSIPHIPDGRLLCRFVLDDLRAWVKQERTTQSGHACAAHARQLIPDSSYVVYFVQAGEAGPIKVGYTAKLRTRFISLQTGNHEQLRLLAAIPGPFSLEGDIHHELCDFHIRGEWFAPAPEVFALIENMKAGRVI